MISFFLIKRKDLYILVDQKMVYFKNLMHLWRLKNGNYIRKTD